MINVEGLVNQALSKLLATFFIEAQEKSDSQPSAPYLQLFEIEGLVRGGKLDSKMAATLGLDFITGARVDLFAVGEEAYEVMATAF